MKTRKIVLILIVLFSFQVNAQKAFDHSIWSFSLLLNVSPEGKVDYQGFMKDSSQLYKYFALLSENPPTEKWSKEEKLAYWINAYNAYTIKLIIDSYPIKSIKDIKDPWDKKFFKIDGEWFSLNNLEHKIIRKLGDPRIHFAINCASFSCPIVWNKAFTSENVNKALDDLTKKFINDPQRNKITKDEYSLSKIFSWYRRDFRVDGQNVTDFINKYSKIKITKQKNKGYMEYDWSLNE